jgi:hypothetical protein
MEFFKAIGSISQVLDAEIYVAALTILRNLLPANHT